jgi:hypothetical protein
MKVKSLLFALFLVYVSCAIYLDFSESIYSLKKMSFDIQSTMLLIAAIFYNEEE